MPDTRAQTDTPTRRQHAGTRRGLAKGAAGVLGAGAAYARPEARQVAFGQTLGSPPPGGGGGGFVPLADLDPDVITVTRGVARPGQTVGFFYVVVNWGDAPAAGTWTDRMFLVRRPDDLTPLLEVATFAVSGPLDPLDSYGRSGSFTLPALPPDDYALVVWADYHDQVREYDVTPFANTLPVFFEVAPPAAGSGSGDASTPGAAASAADGPRTARRAGRPQRPGRPPRPPQPG